ncbi:MAG: PIG-L family deacetylase [Fimbriimonadales bacterium]|nr:PIG-L family deacetylase [Fimbriimonadales bacterium]
MRRRPRGWRGFARAVGSVIGLTGLGLLGVYLWQPQRIELFPGEPPNLPPVRLGDTGLLRPGARVLLVTAHPDDEAFYVGGTLLRLRETGAEVRLVVMTDGDKGYYPLHDARATARIRRQEQLRAAQLFGIRSVRFLGLPDGRLQPSEEAIRKLEPEFREFQPEILLTFDPEHVRRVYHRDHRHAGLAAVEAARRSGFEGWMLLFSTRAANTGLDASDVWDEAQRLLGVHASQFSGPRLAYIQSMVDGRAREAARRMGLEGRRLEPFRAIRVGDGR